MISNDLNISPLSCYEIGEKAMNGEIRMTLDLVVDNFIKDDTREFKYQYNKIKKNKRRFNPTYLGKTSASNTTVSIPSRASEQAAYEPAGPPPITSTEVFSGIDIAFFPAWLSSMIRGKF